MNYKLYILEYLFLSISLAAGLFYFGDQDLFDAATISFPTALLTVGNKFFRDKKKLKKQ